jgi:hypothetical protein
MLIIKLIYDSYRFLFILITLLPGFRPRVFVADKETIGQELLRVLSLPHMLYLWPTDEYIGTGFALYG